MLFYGEPGIGKTSAARILIKNMVADNYEINGSFKNGERTMLKVIEDFATSASILGGPKICFIDEADYMSKDAQASLRNLIENVSQNTRFILTANDIGRLLPAIRSRCHPICFDVRPTDKQGVVEKMTKRYIHKFNEMRIEVDPIRLAEIVSIYFPDFRSISNQFELEFAI
jgi:DNA polymerase III delta prime subunit